MNKFSYGLQESIGFMKKASVLITETTDFNTFFWCATQIKNKIIVLETHALNTWMFIVIYLLVSNTTKLLNPTMYCNMKQ